jgi:ABC-type branched-subunit amino acid transport system permease subunit
MRVSSRFILILLLVLALMAAPLVLSGWVLFLLTVAGAKALAVLGVVLLLRAKLLTFGHALYYAAGAYAAGLGVKYLSLHNGFALIGIAFAAGLTVSALLGLLVIRYRGVYFALLNLAFSMVLYGILLKFYTVTGGYRRACVSGADIWRDRPTRYFASCAIVRAYTHPG